MPPKTVKCCICGEEVTKRSTLKIGEGRACRNHPEVVDFVESVKEERLNVAAMEKFQDMAIVSQIRVAELLNPLLGMKLRSQLRHNFKGARLDKILDELDARGPMTQEEAVGSLLAYGEMKKRAGQ